MRREERVLATGLEQHCGFPPREVAGAKKDEHHNLDCVRKSRGGGEGEDGPGAHPSRGVSTRDRSASRGGRRLMVRAASWGWREGLPWLISAG